MTKSKLERVLEHVVNDEADIARSLLHEHFVESAREIYADLVEEDELAEDELDMDEGYDVSDKSKGFVDDIETMESEINAEEYFEDDDDADVDEIDADDADADLSDEMDVDEIDATDADKIDADLDADDISGAMVNVEDALEELRAAFDEHMADADDADDADADDEDVDDFDDEFNDESDDSDDSDFGDMDDDLEESLQNLLNNVPDGIDESAELKAVPAISRSSESSKSPVGPGNKKLATSKPVDFSKASEKTRNAPTVGSMKYKGPQAAGAKLQKVSIPKNKAEKAKSNIGS